MDIQKITRNSKIDDAVSEVVSELLNASVSFHKLHLKVTGTGSYASHKALNELYDALPDHADNLAEQYQGSVGRLLSYKESSPKILNSVKESISYIISIYEMIDGLQKQLSQSEIINVLDETKSLLNSSKYKLTFLS